MEEAPCHFEQSLRAPGQAFAHIAALPCRQLPGPCGPLRSLQVAPHRFGRCLHGRVTLGETQDLHQGLCRPRLLDGGLCPRNGRCIDHSRNHGLERLRGCAAPCLHGGCLLSRVGDPGLPRPGSSTGTACRAHPVPEACKWSSWSALPNPLPAPACLCWDPWMDLLSGLLPGPEALLSPGFCFRLGPITLWLWRWTPAALRGPASTPMDHLSHTGAVS